MPVERDSDEEDDDDAGSSFDPYISFNLTMEEEFRKIRNHTVRLKEEQAKAAATSQMLIPCAFLRYVAGATDDLEKLAFQLDVNHSANFPEKQVTAAQKAATEKETFGHKIFKLFKPSVSTDVPVPRVIVRPRGFGSRTNSPRFGRSATPTSRRH